MDGQHSGLAIIARLVNETGMEPEVTLIVGGTVLVGTMISDAKYMAGLMEQLGTANVNFTPSEGQSSEDVEKFREGWRTGFQQPMLEAVERFRGRETRLEPEGDDSVEGEQREVEEICLRNAEIRTGVPMNWTTCPLLLIDMRNVGAFTLGIGR